MTAKTDPYFLSKGAHNSPADGRCAMEWVAYLAGEPHSDKPVCVSAVLQRFCIAFNDRLGDDDRQRLRPYLARTIGTAGDGLDPERVQMCREWLVKEAAPRWLDLAGRQELAEQLRELPEALTAEDTVRLIQQVRDEAYNARAEARKRLVAKLREEFGKRLGSAYAAAAAAAAAAATDAYVAAAADVAAAYANAAYADATDAYATDAYVAAAAGPSLTKVRNTVYETVRARMLERLKPIRDEQIESGFQLLDRMLPKVAIFLPVETAERVVELEAVNA